MREGENNVILIMIRLKHPLGNNDKFKDLALCCVDHMITNEDQ